jgi:hypothetical protein
VNSKEMEYNPQTLLELSLFTAAKLALNFETYNFYVRMVSLKDLGLPQKLYDLLWKKAKQMAQFKIDHGDEMESDSFVIDCNCCFCSIHSFNIQTGKISLDCQCDDCCEEVIPELLIRYTRLATLRKTKRRFLYSRPHVSSFAHEDDWRIEEWLWERREKKKKPSV